MEIRKGTGDGSIDHVSPVGTMYMEHKQEVPANNFFIKSFFGRHIHMSYFGATGTLVLDF